MFIVAQTIYYNTFGLMLLEIFCIILVKVCKSKMASLLKYS